MEQQTENRFINCSLLLGLIFLVFGGLNGFFHFLHTPGPTGVAAQFFGAIFVSHFYGALSSSDCACRASVGQPLRSSGADDTRSDYLQYRLHSPIHDPCRLAPRDCRYRPLAPSGLFRSICLLRNLSALGAGYKGWSRLICPVRRNKNFEVETKSAKSPDN